MESSKENKTFKQLVEDCVNCDMTYYGDDSIRFTIDRNFNNIANEIIKNDKYNVQDSIIYCLVEKFGSNKNTLTRSLKLSESILQKENDESSEDASLRSVGHHSIMLPHEEAFDFLPSNVAERVDFKGKREGLLSGRRFGYSNNCYINYSELDMHTIFIDLFKCDEFKGAGRELMNSFLHHILNIRPNVKYVELKAVPFITFPHATDSDIITAQTKLNQYYRDIGFQKIGVTDNRFRGNVNDILYYTVNYVKNNRGGRKRGKRKSRRTRKSKKGTKRHRH